MKFRILPVRKAATAVAGRTAKEDVIAVVLREAELPSHEKMFAATAKAKLRERPPLLKRIVLLEQTKL